MLNFSKLIALLTLLFSAQPVYAFFLFDQKELGNLKKSQLNLTNIFNTTFTLVNKQKLPIIIERMSKIVSSKKDIKDFVVTFLVRLCSENLSKIKFSSNFSFIMRCSMQKQPIVVAIDAGHGGQDPGAIGYKGLQEKKITISIARKLKILLDADPMFHSILTRNGDYFISVKNRSILARKQGANLLVSIHANAAPNRCANGASVWVISNQRATSEIDQWLEQNNKKYELLGGVADILANSKADPYLSRTVLDLQFGYSQRVGYNIAMNVLCQLQNICTLYKRIPEYASFGILRSPDIPSILVETGFLSHVIEGQLLGNNSYQNKIANAIHIGIRNYYITDMFHQCYNLENYKTDNYYITKHVNTCTCILPSNQHHVLRGETLYSIANLYGVNINRIRLFNQLKKNGVLVVGQKLLIPDYINSCTAPTDILCRHRVVHGDTLTTIANRYGVSSKAIKKANNIKKSSNIILGQLLTIPII